MILSPSIWSWGGGYSDRGWGGEPGLGRGNCTVIKIRYTDLPEGLHVEVRFEGPKTIIYLAPVLTRAQRRAALGKARQAARVGRSVPLPVIPLALAIGTDRVKITMASAAAAARVHPVAFAVPAAILITAVILYTFVASVTMHLSRPPQALGPRAGNATSPAAPAPRRARGGHCRRSTSVAVPTAAPSRRPAGSNSTCRPRGCRPGASRRRAGLRLYHRASGRPRRRGLLPHRRRPAVMAETAARPASGLGIQVCA